MAIFSAFFLLLCVIDLVSLAPAVHGPVENFEVKVDESTGGYQIYLSGNLWFTNADVWFRSNGKWYSTQDKSLTLTGKSTSTGRLDWGPMDIYTFNWETSDKKHFTTYTVIFQEVPAAIFGQQWDDGASNANTGMDNDTISLWPTFKMEDVPQVDRGYMTYSNNMAATVKVDKFSSAKPIYSNKDGGFPIAIFDSKLENTVVLSPQNTFMSAMQTSFVPKSYNVPIFGFGILGMVDNVPKGYAMETLMVAGQNITETMDKWGRLLRIRYKKEDQYRQDDFTINYLGYYTDNGACYYYYTGDYANYEEALIAVKRDADNKGIPYCYLQIDSWWYFKGILNGVKNWTAMPNVFPHGIEYVSNITGWPIVAHNRYWSSNTDYAKQNGGNFNFIVDEGGFALPDDPEFWRYLLSTSRNQWNLWVYEQDWLDSEFSNLRELEADLNLGQTWLQQMGEAAKELGLTIQYCMAWPRHVLQSVMIPVVTQIRVSDDYRPGNPPQWMVGDTTILAHAMGLAAFKDDFHTTSNQSKCAFTNPEPYPELETFVAALTGGPVGPSDTVDGANKDLIMATCMSDGLLLKPTRPAMSLDSTFLYRAFLKGGPCGYLTAAYTEISGLTWYYILAADMQTDYQLHLTELPPSHSVKPQSFFPPALAIQYTLNGTISHISILKENTDYLAISKCGRSDFQYWMIAPLLPNTNIALLGELDKVVTVSEQRVLTIMTIGSKFIVRLRGAPMEIVNMSIIDTNGKLNSIQCTIASDGTGGAQVMSSGVISC